MVGRVLSLVLVWQALSKVGVPAFWMVFCGLDFFCKDVWRVGKGRQWFRVSISVLRQRAEYAAAVLHRAAAAEGDVWAD